MRLCLDGHYSPTIAQKLREAGHDVEAVKERPELVELSDAHLLALMTSERRALLTENVGDFAPLARQMVARGEDHYGLIFSSPHSMPRSRNTIGEFVRRLDEILRRHPGDDDFVNRVEWL